MKADWKKEEKHLYLPPREPSLIDVPTLRFIAIRGEGNPNMASFSEHVGVLYSLVYTIRMMPKSGFTPEGYEAHSMFPLEGVWTLSEPWEEGAPLAKEKLQYTLMIRQPDFVTEGVYAHAMDTVKRKKPHPLLDEVFLMELTEGLCVQMLHIGPYDDEPASFARMDAFLEEQGLERIDHFHREIYLGDPRRGKPENRRTMLRYQVRKA